MSGQRALAQMCSLCATQELAVSADWEVAYADEATALASCTAHLGDSVALAVLSQSAAHVTVYDLNGSP